MGMDGDSNLNGYFTSMDDASRIDGIEVAAGDVVRGVVIETPDGDWLDVKHGALAFQAGKYVKYAAANWEKLHALAEPEPEISEEDGGTHHIALVAFVPLSAAVGERRGWGVRAQRYKAGGPTQHKPVITPTRFRLTGGFG